MACTHLLVSSACRISLMQYGHGLYKLAMSCWEPQGYQRAWKLTDTHSTCCHKMRWSGVLAHAGQPPLLQCLLSCSACALSGHDSRLFTYKLPFLHDVGRRTNAETAASKPRSCGPWRRQIPAKYWCHIAVTVVWSRYQLSYPVMERSYAWRSLARLARGASGRPSVCWVIPASDCIAGLMTDSLKCNWDCPCADEFPSQLNTSTWTNRGTLLKRQ